MLIAYLDDKVLLKVLHLLVGVLHLSEEEDRGLFDIVVGDIPALSSHLSLEPVHDFKVIMCAVVVGGGGG